MQQKLLWLIIISCSHRAVTYENKMLHRTKRAYFLFPMGGQFKLVLAISVPVKLGSKQSMAFAVNLQFQYAVATSIEQFTQYPPTISRSREKRERPRSDRAIAYLGLELIMERYGLNGQSCLLKYICETAMGYLYHEANGLYGHLLHILLTPDYGDNEVDNDLNPIYFEAQKAGRYGVDCNSLYSNCSHSQDILDIISAFDV